MITITWSETYEAWLLTVDGCEIQTAELLEQLQDTANKYREWEQ